MPEGTSESESDIKKEPSKTGKEPPREGLRERIRGFARDLKMIFGPIPEEGRKLSKEEVRENVLELKGNLMRIIGSIPGWESDPEGFLLGGSSIEVRDLKYPTTYRVSGAEVKRGKKEAGAEFRFSVESNDYRHYRRGEIRGTRLKLSRGGKDGILLYSSFENSSPRVNTDVALKMATRLLGVLEQGLRENRPLPPKTVAPSQ